MANVHDIKLLKSTLDKIVIFCPEVCEKYQIENLCLYAGYLALKSRLCLISFYETITGIIQWIECLTI